MARRSRARLVAIIFLFHTGCQSKPIKPVALVDHTPITREELIAAYTYFQPANVYELATLESLREKLDELIDERLILLEARKIYNRDQDAQSEITEVRRLQLYNYALNRLVYEKRFPDSELRKYYQYLRKERRIRHIFLPLNPIAPESERQAAYERMMQLRRELLQGADFAELARHHSRDRTSASKGGDLGFVAWHAVPFEMAAYALKIGEISEPVRTEMGYHLIQVTGERDMVVPPYEEARYLILNHLKRAKARELTGALDEKARELQERYHFKIHHGNLTHVVEKLRSAAATQGNEPLAFTDIFTGEEMSLPLAEFDGGSITVRDLGANFYAIQNEQQLGSWLETTGRQALFIHEAEVRGWDKDPVFQKLLQEAIDEEIRKNYENRIVEARANALAQQQGKRPMRMSDWRRLKNQVRRAWLAELRKNHTIHIDEAVLQEILKEFLSKAR